MGTSTLPLSFGLIGGRPVFMDVTNDLYFRLPIDKERSFIAALEESQSVGQPITQGLARGGETREWRIEPVPSLPAPQRALSSERVYSGFAEILAVGKIVLGVRRALRTRSIADILRPLAMSGSDSAVLGIDPLTPATTFRNARRFVPVSGNCLSDSLALIRWLGHKGAGATLVFGVKLEPFAAHCWVQSGPVLLADYPERVERFTPVRILECTPAMR